MELSEALNFVDSLNLDEKTVDFSEFTDEQLLSISITLDLLSLDEAKAFELELAKRQLTERYFSTRKPKMVKSKSRSWQMKILSSKRFGRRLVLTLEENLPDDFKNNSKISIDGHIFTDSLVTMTSEKKSRNVLSVLFDGVSNVDGKELVIL